MNSDRRTIYSIILIACFAGYIWLYFNISSNIIEKKNVELCPIKHVTNIPCPSCGSTRSIISLTKGHFGDALLINPFGIVVATIMLIAPLWIIFDLATRRKSFFVFYQKIEEKIRKPKIAISLILLVIINWIWNITKGL